MEKKNFFEKAWFIILMLIFVPPVGLILIWTCKKNWNKIVKILLSVLFGFWALIWGIMLFVPDDKQTSGEVETTTAVFESETEIPEETGTVAQSLTAETEISEFVSDVESSETDFVVIVAESTTEEITVKQENNTEEPTVTRTKNTTAKPTTTTEPIASKSTTKTVSTKPITEKLTTTVKETTTKKATTTVKSTTQKHNNSVVVPDKTETKGNLVWVPTNGGTKYHSHPGCSNMKDPKQVSVETAKKNGYTACKRCY